MTTPNDQAASTAAPTAPSAAPDPARAPTTEPAGPRDRIEEAWPGWPLLGSRLLELIPEGLREAVAVHPDDGFAVEETVEDGFVVVRAECPGVDPETDIDVTVEEGVLSIRVHRQDTRSQGEGGQRRSEFRYGRFTRRLPLPRGASADVVSASYTDGILEVRLPAPAPVQQVRRVPVARS